MITVRPRLILLVLLVFLLATTPFLLFAPRQPVTYQFPNSVLADYTSPASHCFWPGQALRSSNTTSPPSSSRKPSTPAGRIKAWVGWGASGSDDSDEPDEDVAEQLDVPNPGDFVFQGQMPDMIPVPGIERYMQAHLDELASSYDEQHDLDEYGLRMGNVSLPAYSAELLSTYRTYLSPPTPALTPPSYLPPVLSRLSLRPPVAPLPERPRQIMTTEKSIDDMPMEFMRWKEIMPDWEIKYFDDASLREWVRGVFQGTKAWDLWQGLPRQVLKTDVFRYMAMLVEGGIYTDSDTAPIIHADLWGYPYQSGTPPLLTHLSRLLSLATTPHLPASHPASSFSAEHAPTYLDEDEDLLGVDIGKSAIYDGPIVDDGAELGLPGLVVSVESDAIDFGWTNWREVGLTRAVQITQWTFMARPGHPVFLDALGRTLRKAEDNERRKKQAQAEGEAFIPESALEWTGPGVFTDCVYRYMLARYGFRPEQLIHQKQPLRVGDVLILPAGSYSSVDPFTDEAQREWAASYHGFRGRWRDTDPGQQEWDRLRKIQEEAEEAEKKAKEDAEEAERKAKELEEIRVQAEKEADEAGRLHELHHGDSGGEQGGEERDIH